MRQRSLRVFVMALWISAAAAVLPASAQAVSDMVGRTVTAVRFDVDGQPDTSPELVALSDMHVGAPLRIEDVRATIGHLDSLGRYDDVIAEANATDGGVEVIFRLIPRHPITRMEVVGDVGISPGELRDLVERQYGGVPTTTRPSAVEATTEQVLHDQGYLDARVTARTKVPPGSASATLVLDVTAGALAHIERTEVRGTSPLAPSDIIRRTGTRVGAVYRRRDVETAVTALEDGLRSRGYYEAQITPQATRTPTGVDVLITVDTGPRVELEVQPSGVLPGSVDELIPIKRLGSANQDLLEDSRARIERALRAQGYWKAQAPFTRTLQQDGKLLVITFTITRGPRFFIDHIELPSSLALPAATIRELIGVQPGDVFDEDRFVTGVARVVDAYRQRGFYRVEADPSYEQTSGGVDGPRATVVLRPDISEGPQGEISEVSFSFADDHQVSEAALRQIMRSRPGRPYVELDAARDRTDILTLYANRGFRTADVSITPSFSNDGHSVSLTVQVNEGRQVLIGDISVVGNERVSTRAILDEMGLRPGQPAGVAALNEAQSRLVEMGVFRRVRVSVPDLAPGESEAHLIVNVVESPASSIGYGGGLEGGRQVRSAVGGGFEDYLALSPRGFFEIGRRNLGGRNRSLNLFSRVSFKPRSAPGDPMRDGRGFGFTEYRVTGTYRERRAFRTDTDLLLGVTSEQAVRTNFNFIRKSANAEVLRKLSDRLSFSGQYRLDFTRLFDERIASNDPILPLIDRLFPQVRLSILSTGISWDRRNNPIAPTRGTLATADSRGGLTGARVRGRLRQDLLSGIWIPLAQRVGAYRAGRPGGDRRRPRLPQDGGRGRRQRQSRRRAGRPADHRGGPRPAGQPAFLRRGEHDRARVPARSAGSAGDHQQGWPLARWQRAGGAQRRNPSGGGPDLRPEHGRRGLRRRRQCLRHHPIDRPRAPAWFDGLRCPVRLAARPDPAGLRLQGAPRDPRRTA